jgi:hypothetical protein
MIALRMLCIGFALSMMFPSMPGSFSSRTWGCTTGEK